MGTAPLGGSCERGKVPAPWKAPHWQGDQPRQKGSFRASEENAAAGFWQPEWRKDCTDGQGHRPAFPSLRNMITSVGWGWVLEFRLWRSDPGRKLGLAVQKQTRGWGVLESGVTATEGLHRGSLGHLRGQMPLLGIFMRGGSGPTTAAFFPVCVLTEGRTLPARASGVVASHCCLPPRLQEWLWAASAPTACSGGASELPQPLRIPGPVISWCICTPTIKGITNSTLWGKRQQASILKKTLTPNILNPHKLHRDAPTYK